MKTNTIILQTVTLFLCTAGIPVGCTRRSAVIPDTITVISRESGSGTREIFTELFGIAQTGNNDIESSAAGLGRIVSGTKDVITTVAENKAAIGYISLGSLNQSVRAVKIDGISPSVADIKNGTYQLFRPFTIVTKTEEKNEAVLDFIRYILSSDGQSLIEKNGYIPAIKNPEYMVNARSGKITVTGSSSVFPVMEKLVRAYSEKNPGITIQVTQSDSATGIDSVVRGICDIGMASRDPDAEEILQNIQSKKIAMDGIAVIVNRANHLSDISKENMRKIYTGDITKWSSLR
jgi:phosphate transport system substrate-binding protein